MNLVQLRYFQAVCRLQNMTHASEALHVSQPSISAAIKELEAEFHVTLFHRRYRGMIMTKEGEQFLALAEGLLNHADQAHQTMEDISRHRQTLRLGIPPMIGTLLLPHILHGFLEKNPNLAVTIEEGGRQDLENRLVNSQLDLAFLPHDRPFEKPLTALPILDLETLCCVSIVHPLASRRRISISDLDGQPLVLFKNSFFQTKTILDRYAHSDCKPNVALYTDQVLTVQKLISRNLAVGFLFDRLVVHLRDLVGIPLDPPLPVHISLVWKEGGYIFPNMERFMEFVHTIPPEAL